MDKFTLVPNKENILNSYKNNALNRNDELFDFLKLLTKIEGGYTIALDSGWGNGKTFFVKQAEMVLASFNGFVENEYQCQEKDIVDVLSRRSNLKTDLENMLAIPIYYDAWKNDNDEDPVLSLLFTIVQSLDLSDKLKDIKVSLGEMIKQVVKAVTGADLTSVVKETDLLQVIRGEKDIEKTIKEFFNKLKDEKGCKIVIFIDELDRCKPSYAVKMLERIKHYFDNENIIFVFSVNVAELEHTIKCLYGNNFSSGKYLNKFFDIRISLSNVKTNYLYAPNGELRNGGWSKDVFECMLRELDFGIRDALEYLAWCENYFGNNVGYRGSEYKKSLIAYLIIPISYALKMVDSNKYYSFINGKEKEYFVEIINNHVDLNRIAERILEEISEQSLGEKLELAYSEIMNTEGRNYDNEFLRKELLKY